MQVLISLIFVFGLWAIVRFGARVLVILCTVVFSIAGGYLAREAMPVGDTARASEWLVFVAVMCGIGLVVAVLVLPLQVSASVSRLEGKVRRLHSELAKHVQGLPTEGDLK